MNHRILVVIKAEPHLIQLCELDDFLHWHFTVHTYFVTVPQNVSNSIELYNLLTFWAKIMFDLFAFDLMLSNLNWPPCSAFTYV